MAIGIELVGNNLDVELGDTGAIELTGDATVWDDLRAPAYALKGGGVKDPGFAQIKDNGAGSTGVFTFVFDAAAEEELFFAFQMPHSYKEGTDVTFHVHFAPTDGGAGTVRWGLEYTWVNQEAVMANTVLAYKDEAVAANDDKHIRSDFVALDGTGKTISSMLMCRVFRDAAHANDTYGADAALLEVDIHYQRDTMGSRQIITK